MSTIIANDPDAARARALLATSTRHKGREHPDTLLLRNAFMAERTRARLQAAIDSAGPLPAGHWQDIVRAGVDALNRAQAAAGNTNH